jgi:hypothetical protein
MRIYEDKNMTDQTFVLEESVFMRCVLKNCDLFYSGGDFEFVELKLDNCRFHFRGPAKNAQMLYMTLGMLRDPSQLPPQGTMTSQRPN